jgi:hypothetical protein
MERCQHPGYQQPIGEHLKYVVKASGKVAVCLAWQSAPRHLRERASATCFLSLQWALVL